MSVKATEERKQLERQLARLRPEIEAKLAEARAANDQAGKLIARKQEIQRRLDELKPKAITVSDHAIVRYLERQCGVDVEAIRKSILESKLPEWVATVGGSGRFPINGYKVVLKDYTVVTIT